MLTTVERRGTSQGTAEDLPRWRSWEGQRGPTISSSHGLVVMTIIAIRTEARRKGPDGTLNNHTRFQQCSKRTWEKILTCEKTPTYPPFLTVTKQKPRGGEDTLAKTTDPEEGPKISQSCNRHVWHPIYKIQDQINRAMPAPTAPREEPEDNQLAEEIIWSLTYNLYSIIAQLNYMEIASAVINLAHYILDEGLPAGWKAQHRETMDRVLDILRWGLPTRTNKLENDNTS